MSQIHHPKFTRLGGVHYFARYPERFRVFDIKRIVRRYHFLKDFFVYPVFHVADCQGADPYRFSFSAGERFAKIIHINPFKSRGWHCVYIGCHQQDNCFAEASLTPALAAPMIMSASPISSVVSSSVR